MRTPRHLQRGAVVMTDLMLAGTFLIILMSAAFTLIIHQSDESMFGEALTTATAIAQRADLESERVTSSTVGANGVYTYTYAGSPTYTTVDTLNALSGITLSTTTPYGTTYTWMADGTGPAKTQFTVPAGHYAQSTHTGVVIASQNGGGYLVTVSALKQPDQVRYTYPSMVKHDMYLEALR